MTIAAGFKTRLLQLLRDESGEVTIEWVAITAAIVALSTALILQIGDGTQQLSDIVGAELSARDVTTVF